MSSDRTIFVEQNAEALLADRDGQIARQRGRITQLEKALASQRELTRIQREAGDLLAVSEGEDRLVAMQIWRDARGLSIGPDGLKKGPRPGLRDVFTSMRRFVIFRHRDVSGVSGTGIVADGVDLPSGKCVIAWRGHTPSIAMYDHISHVERVHCHKGESEIVFIDDWPERASDPHDSKGRGTDVRP